MTSPTADTLAASYAHCTQVAKTQARNFYYSFLTLPAEPRAAMCAIYAFMRYSDDVSDEAAADSSKVRDLADWRAALDRAFRGDYGGSLILPAFHDTMQKYGIPARYFHDLIDGTEMDLTKNRYETFAELRQYCYRVAGVVGFVCIHVWGFDEAGGKALEYAEDCGLARFQVTEEDLKTGKLSDGFRELMRFEVERAKGFYRRAEQLLPLVHPGGRPTLTIMMNIYRGILDSIERNNYDVHSRRARVSTPRKLGIVAGAWLRSRLPGA